MVSRAQEPPLFSVQMELVFWLTKRLSWKDGLRTLIVFLIEHHINEYAINRLPQVECNLLLDEFPTVAETSESNKTSLIWQGSRVRCNTCWDLQSRRNSSCTEGQSYSTLCGEKKPSLKKLRMRQLFTYSNGKGILSCVIIIVASLYCQLLGRSLQEFYLPTEWTLWTVRASTRKPVWIQKGQRNNWHDLHSKAASREIPGTEHGPLHGICWPYQTLIQSVVRVFGKLWRNLVVRPSS